MPMKWYFNQEQARRILVAVGLMVGFSGVVARITRADVQHTHLAHDYSKKGVISTKRSTANPRYHISQLQSGFVNVAGKSYFQAHFHLEKRTDDIKYRFFFSDLNTFDPTHRGHWTELKPSSGPALSGKTVEVLFPSANVTATGYFMVMAHHEFGKTAKYREEDEILADDYPTRLEWLDRDAPGTQVPITLLPSLIASTAFENLPKNSSCRHYELFSN